MKLTRSLAIVAATLIVALGAGVASAHPISQSCIDGPGTPTCFRPNLLIPGNQSVVPPPLFVEVVNDGGDTILSIQANLTGNEFIGNVRMNLDPSIDPTALTFTFLDTTSDIDPNDVVIATAENGINLPPPAPGLGADNFDIGFNFPPPPGNTTFDGTELIEWTVTCDATTDPDCAGFGVTSFNFTNEGGFRICAHVPGGLRGGAGVCGTPRSEAVPEPTTLTLVGAAVVGLGAILRRRIIRR